MNQREMVVVTGAGSGIGAATATRFVAQKRRVMVIGRTLAKLQLLRDGLGDSIIVHAGDVGLRTDVETIARRIRDERSTVLALVNCAGIALGGSSDQGLAQLESAWRSVISTNLTGPFLMSMAIAPLLRRPGGRIVNISSIAAYTGGQSKGSSIYAASKAGLHGLSAGLARELSDVGITVNTIAPGFIEGTEFSREWPAQRMKSIVAQTPVGRPGTADEVASLIEYLCSPEAGFITGQVISQNGGWRFTG
jgi:3-oxoacyl-[acyl-carrier protein] reductase